MRVVGSVLVFERYGECRLHFLSSKIEIMIYRLGKI